MLISNLRRGRYLKAPLVLAIDVLVSLSASACVLLFTAVIGDVRQEERLDYVFVKYRPEIVFHAAAYKHVPLMEKNPCEAVLVNVVGT